MIIALQRALAAQQSVAGDTVLPRRIQLGASLVEVPDSLRARGTPAGALVIGVVSGSPASSSGLGVGDVITRIGSDTVRTVADALGALKPLRPGISVPLAIARDGRATRISVLTRERPREASREFAIEYRAVAASGGKHRVLVTHPNDHQRHPAVLFIGGIGCYANDTPVGPSSYRELAYHLTRHGYTTVRVEKLGVGDSEGGPCIDTDFATELDGYRQALRAMSSYPSVDSQQIFLFGHSIGGIEAPLIAGEADAPIVRGVAVLSTTGIAWYEYELANLRRQLRLQHLAPDSIEHEMHLKTTCGYEFLVAKQHRDAILAREALCAGHIDYPASDAYMQSVAGYTPAAVWKTVAAPALVMYGLSDFITSREEHVSLAADINAMHPGAATHAEIPDLDHYISREASQQTSFDDPVSGLLRPYYGATLEPVLDRWLDAHRVTSASAR